MHVTVTVSQTYVVFLRHSVEGRAAVARTNDSFRVNHWHHRWRRRKTAAMFVKLVTASHTASPAAAAF